MSGAFFAEKQTRSGWEIDRAFFFDRQTQSGWPGLSSRERSLLADTCSRGVGFTDHSLPADRRGREGLSWEFSGTFFGGMQMWLG